MVSVFLTAELYSIRYMYLIFIIIHSSAEGHLGCSHFLAVVTRKGKKNAKQVFVEEDVKSFGHM